MKTRLGWSAKFNEPGGFLYDSKARFRPTAKTVIVLTVIAIILQIIWMAMLFLDLVPDAWIEEFIYEAIFFTLLTNIVAWGFVNLTWKYAKDSQSALDEYSDNLQMQMQELGFTLIDLNEFGRALKESGLKASDLQLFIKVVRELREDIYMHNVKMADIKQIIRQIPKAKKAIETEQTLKDTHRFDIFGGE